MVDWVDEMIIREATPKTLRKETVEEFCKLHGISDATYYNHSSREDNQKKIVKVAVTLVKKSLPEVLEKLREKAEGGDMKAVDMFLNYVAELSKNLDIKSDGKALPQPIVSLSNDILRNNSNSEDTITNQED